MTETTWKVVMDQDRVTISGDRFVLTTNDSAPDRLDTVISELQSMTRTSYGQHCGVSRAIEMVGERWSLLIIRDLLAGPKSEAELRRGLPLIPERLLAMRLKEMAYSGVLGSTEAETGTRYELTGYGRALEDVVLALGRWGVMALDAPRPEDVITEDAVLTALRASFQPGAARDVHVCFELHVVDVVVHAVVDHGRLDLYRGPTSDADAVLDPGPMLKPLLTGEVSAADALAGGQVGFTGAPELLSWFAAMFHVPVLPSPVAA